MRETLAEGEGALEVLLVIREPLMLDCVVEKAKAMMAKDELRERAAAMEASIPSLVLQKNKIVPIRGAIDVLRY
jgi:hypothetical protein